MAIVESAIPGVDCGCGCRHGSVPCVQHAAEGQFDHTCSCVSCGPKHHGRRRCTIQVSSTLAMATAFERGMITNLLFCGACCPDNCVALKQSDKHQEGEHSTSVKERGYKNDQSRRKLDRSRSPKNDRHVVR